MNKMHVGLVGIVTLAAAAGIAACSSSSSNTTPGVKNDAGQDTSSLPDTAQADTTGDDGGLPDTSGTETSTGDGGCAKPPALHVPAADGGIYCPYSYNDATEAGIQYCGNGAQQCCLSASSDAGPSTCEAFTGTSGDFATACGTTGATVWQCASPNDCVTAGPLLPGAEAGVSGDPIVCCLLGGTLEADTSCPGYEKTHFGGTTCQPRTACAGTISVTSAGKTYADPLFVACEQDSDCTGVTGTTHCQAIFTSGTSIGVCQ